MGCMNIKRVYNINYKGVCIVICIHSLDGRVVHGQDCRQVQVADLEILYILHYY